MTGPGWASGDWRHAAGGRRAMIAKRRRVMQARRAQIAELLFENDGLARGEPARLAKRFGVSETTISNDVAAILQEAGATRCTCCGAVPPTRLPDDDVPDDDVEEAQASSTPASSAEPAATSTQQTTPTPGTAAYSRPGSSMEAPTDAAGFATWQAEHVEPNRETSDGRTTADDDKSLIHRDGSSYDADLRAGARLVDEAGRTLIERMPTPGELPTWSSISPHPR